MEVPYRMITRADFTLEQVHSWGFSSTFVVVEVACATCQRKTRVVSQPVESQDHAAEECLLMLTREGWRALEDSGPVCAHCVGASEL